jgi:hypothetical protein
MLTIPEAVTFSRTVAKGNGLIGCRAEVALVRRGRPLLVCAYDNGKLTISREDGTYNVQEYAGNGSQDHE